MQKDWDWCPVLLCGVVDGATALGLGFLAQLVRNLMKSALNPIFLLS